MNITSIAKKLKQLKNVVILTHIKPDGDAVGSAYALHLILKAANIQSKIVCDSPVPEKFAPFVDIGAFFREINGSFDAYVSVDSSDEMRLGAFGEQFKAARLSFNFDHHISNTKFAKYNLVLDYASSAEVVYLIAKALGVLLDKQIAQSLLLGICTDTGNFAHKNVTKSTLQTAGEMVEAGADLNAINYAMFKKQPIERARLFANVASKLKMYENGKIAVITTMLKDIENSKAEHEMTEGFIDFALSIDTVEVAISLLQYKESQFKVSFRSKGGVDVNEVAGVFGGGGHILASGCMLQGDVESVLDKLIFTVKMRL